MGVRIIPTGLTKALKNRDDKELAQGHRAGHGRDGIWTWVVYGHRLSSWTPSFALCIHKGANQASLTDAPGLVLFLSQPLLICR